jgi:hypothetical protein
VLPQVRSGTNCDRTTSGRGPSPGSTSAILGEARTQLTHISTIPYIEVQVEVIATAVTREGIRHTGRRTWPMTAAVLGPPARGRVAGARV